MGLKLLKEIVLKYNDTETTLYQNDIYCSQR